ncbi:LysR family transcriptional regulator [Ottowia thiooxydans]|uniref:LysR family transcriptional regulator n=1 Tax=Ottowia thiooxydans TaxID=219182 RepID=UPI0004091534|nr:LysR family transcriptional regulator [Ottowia thiooxydans]
MDRLNSMRVFTLAAQSGTLSSAARALDMSPSMATKHVDALEARLGVKLLHRSTRKLVLTEAGEAYLEAALRILDDVDDADAAATAQRTRATGVLRLNMPHSYGMRHIAPLIPAFSEAHPAVSLELGMTDAPVDLVSERWDMAVRIGHLHDDTLQARRLGDCRMILCASPSYLKRHGAPKTVADLAHHNCLGYTLSITNTPAQWRFGADGSITQAVQGNLRANSGEALLAAALGGQGLIYHPTFILDASIAKGELVALTLDHPTHELGGIYAVWPANRHPPAKVRVMVDFLVAKLGQAPG